MVPSYILQDRDTLKKTLMEHFGGDEGSRPAFANFSPEKIKEVHTFLASHRSSEADRSRLSAALSNYVGTKKYHNFTSHLSATDPSAKRYMMSFDVLPQIFQR